MKALHGLACAATALLAGAVCAQGSYTPYGNGPVVVVPQGNGQSPYGYVAPGYGAVQPYNNGSGLVMTPQGATPYGRYNKDAARDAFRINNALGGARAADEAAARSQAPMTPLNPMPGGLR